MMKNFFGSLLGWFFRRIGSQLARAIMRRRWLLVFAVLFAGVAFATAQNGYYGYRIQNTSASGIWLFLDGASSMYDSAPPGGVATGDIGYASSSSSHYFDVRSGSSSALPILGRVNFNTVLYVGGYAVNGTWTGGPPPVTDVRIGYSIAAAGADCLGRWWRAYCATAIGDKWSIWHRAGNVKTFTLATNATSGVIQLQQAAYPGDYYAQWSDSGTCPIGKLLTFTCQNGTNVPVGSGSGTNSVPSAGSIPGYATNYVGHFAYTNTSASYVPYNWQLLDGSGNVITNGTGFVAPYSTLPVDFVAGAAGTYKFDAGAALQNTAGDVVGTISQGVSGNLVPVQYGDTNPVASSRVFNLEHPFDLVAKQVPWATNNTSVAIPNSTGRGTDYSSVQAAIQTSDANAEKRFAEMEQLTVAAARAARQDAVAVADSIAQASKAAGLASAALGTNFGEGDMYGSLTGAWSLATGPDYNGSWVQNMKSTLSSKLPLPVVPPGVAPAVTMPFGTISGLTDYSVDFGAASGPLKLLGDWAPQIRAMILVILLVYVCFAAMAILRTAAPA